MVHEMTNSFLKGAASLQDGCSELAQRAPGKVAALATVAVVAAVAGIYFGFSPMGGFAAVIAGSATITAIFAAAAGLAALAVSLTITVGFVVLCIAAAQTVWK